jgi:hypothetical protein
MQNIVVALIVTACFVYAAQAVMPAALSRKLARWLAEWPHWPAPLARRLRRAARAPMASCGCEGCDRSATVARAAAAAPGRPQTINIQRRRP